MLRKKSLWGIYFASYLVDYILILTILIYKRLILCKRNQIPFWDVKNLIAWSVLFVMIVGSISIAYSIKRIKMNSRIKMVPQKNITLEMMGYVATQVVVCATTMFTDRWILINTVIFVMTGVYFVNSKKLYTSPLFVFPLGNKVYEAGDSVIITRYSLQGMRLAQEENPDGIEARELTDKVYYVR